MNTLRSPNRRPTHPGELLREDVFPALGSPESWLAMQTALDIWEARRLPGLDTVKPLPKRRTAEPA
jgi:plasmid maintenance system antidote protein VapI